MNKMNAQFFGKDLEKPNGMKGSLHFPGLAGIRAIAASIVVLFHIDQQLPMFGCKSFGYHKTGMAGFAVVLFFVLSGFLITQILLREKKDFGTIDIQKFYLRRILRIWPIYYLVIFTTILLFILGFLDYTSNTTFTIVMYSLFLSNIAYGLGFGGITLAPLWSVGVEEQFYVFWPFLVKKSRNVITTLFFFLAFYLLVKLFFISFEKKTIYSIVNLTSFSSMAIGGIFASLVFFNINRILKVLYNPMIQVVCWMFLFISVFYKPVHFFSIIDLEMHSFVYAIIIVNVSTNPHTLIRLENTIFKTLGRISYGLYVFHMPVIFFFMNLFEYSFFQKSNDYLKYFIVYISVVSVSVFLSLISYEYFEKFFLKQKEKFAKIHTHN